jgi:hypothetical protein
MDTSMGSQPQKNTKPNHFSKTTFFISSINDGARIKIRRTEFQVNIRKYSFAAKMGSHREN